MPNLLPFIAAAFVGQVFSAVFASFYLAVLGLGPLREPLLGNIIWAAQGQGAFFNGWWWWPIWPAIAMVLSWAPWPSSTWGWTSWPTRASEGRSDDVADGTRSRAADLRVSYYTDAGRAMALDGVNLDARRRGKAGPGRGVGLGEEHHGPGHDAHDQAARAHRERPGLRGRAPTSPLSGRGQMLKARLSKIAYIPQGAMNSLNPVTRIGAQMVDAIKAHEPGHAESEHGGALHAGAWSRWTSSGQSSRCTPTS